MTPEPIPVPLAKAALDHPSTSVGHRRLVVKRRLWLIAMLLMGVALTYAAASLPPADRVGFIVLSVIFYPLIMFVTCLALHRTKRVATILRTYPWRAYPCGYPRRSLESPRAVVIRFSEDHAPVLRTTQYSGHLQNKQNPHPDMIWFAGDPRFGGVVSPVGGHFPVRVVPESMGDALPPGTPEDDALAERAGLVTGGRVHTT
ncbi:hypothetical protein [Streptomyces sp. NPDC020681]|uniref:hypothetical protein n=1 Tax=Streptomyces sp. NPDC020681 TaxID=3365083 RepID=UPI0037B2DE1D